MNDLGDQNPRAGFAPVGPSHPAWCDGNGRTECWDCGGQGGFHDCGEDCCACVNPEEVTEDCVTCGGHGFIRCPACREAAHAAEPSLEEVSPEDGEP